MQVKVRRRKWNRRLEFKTRTRLFAFAKVMNPTLSLLLTRSAGTAEYADCISAVGKTPPTSVLDIILNNLMVRFQ